MMETVPLLQETVFTLMDRNALLFPDKTAFIFDGTSYTWAKTAALTDRIAGGMLAKGIKKGSRVGVWSMNSIDLVLYIIAAAKIGAISAVINYSYRTFELRGVLRRADIEMLFLGENKKGSDYRAMVDEVWRDCPWLRSVWDMADDLASIRHSWPLEQALPDCVATLLDAAKGAVDTGDVVAITFTSGTTKEPKPVMLTHYSIINDVNQFTHRMRVSVNNSDVLMAPLPLFHCSGLSGMLFFALVVGIPAIIHRSFIAQTALEDIEHYKVTALMAVPTMLELMIHHEDFTKFDLSSLRIVQTFGSSTSPAKLRKIKEDLGLEEGESLMNILVCIKQVPDTTEIKIDPVKNTLVRDEVPSIVNPFDGYALEAAGRIKDKDPGTRIVVLTMGPPQAAAALKECLAIAADKAYLVSGRTFGGSDTLATSYILYNAVKKVEELEGAKFDAIFCGKQAIDGDTAQVGPELAEHLGYPQVTYGLEAEVEGNLLKVKKEVEEGVEVIGVNLPCLVTFTKPAWDPRYPTIKRKMAAKELFELLSTASIL